jgi:hypothetical protein
VGSGGENHRSLSLSPKEDRFPFLAPTPEKDQHGEGLMEVTAVMKVMEVI